MGSIPTAPIKMSQQEKYKEEFEKYKHIALETGFYKQKNTFFEFEILSITDDWIEIKAKHSGVIKKKTPHWCRKNLEKI